MSNNAVGFQACVIENLATVFLGQGHFEEQVSFQKNEASRAFNVMVCLTHDDGGLEREAHHQTERRRMTVLCSKDPIVVNADGSRATWSAVTGETYSPGLGNIFQRSDGTWWSWIRVTSEDFASWTLTFESYQLRKAGGRPMSL